MPSRASARPVEVKISSATAFIKPEALVFASASERAFENASCKRPDETARISGGEGEAGKQRGLD
jgi:hypothetical protein